MDLRLHITQSQNSLEVDNIRISQDAQEDILQGSFTPIPVAPPTIDSSGLADSPPRYHMTTSFVVPGSAGAQISAFRGGGHVIDTYDTHPDTGQVRQTLSFSPRNVGIAQLSGNPTGGMTATVRFTFAQPVTASDVVLVFIRFKVGSAEYVAVAATAV